MEQIYIGVAGNISSNVTHANRSLTSLPTPLPEQKIMEGAHAQSVVVINPESVFTSIDEATFRIARFVFSVILFPSIGIVGTVSNFFALVVLVKQGVSHPSSVSMLNMAACNLLLSAMVFCVYTDGFIGDFNSPGVKAFLNIRDEVFVPIRIVLRTLSSICVPFMAIERFVAIYFPFAATKIFSKRRTVLLFALLWLTHVAFFLPILNVKNYYLVPTEIPAMIMNGTIATNTTTVTVFKVRLQDWYLYAIYAFTPVVWQVIPYTLTTVISIAIGIKLRKVAMWRKSQQQATTKAFNRSSSRVTKVVLCLMVIFIISMLPYNYLSIVCLMDHDYCIHLRTRDLMFHRYWISFTGAINYTSSFFVYVIGNERFRATFLDIFFRRCTISPIARAQTE